MSALSKAPVNFQSPIGKRIILADNRRSGITPVATLRLGTNLNKPGTTRASRQHQARIGHSTPTSWCVQAHSCVNRRRPQRDSATTVQVLHSNQPRIEENQSGKGRLFNTMADGGWRVPLNGPSQQKHCRVECWCLSLLRPGGCQPSAAAELWRKGAIQFMATTGKGSHTSS